MTWERALEADARLAARNAVLIRAALRQSFDPERAFIGYQNTTPDDSLTLPQQRSRARSWAIMNIRPNLEPLRQVLIKIWADAYALGDTAAREAIEEAKRAQKADAQGVVDWSKWKPGDAAQAIILKPPRAFQRLLEGAGITLKGFSDTTLTDIGNSIGEAIELGLDAKRSAKLIGNHVASPARALSIAITEQNRAISTATQNRYLEAGLKEQEWLVFEPCKICAQNAGQKVSIGAPFPSGNTQPPAHPNCRCALAPVIPGFDDPSNTAGTVTQPVITPTGALEEKPFVADAAPGTWTVVEQQRWRDRQTAVRVEMGLEPPNEVMLKIIDDQYKDSRIIWEKGPHALLVHKDIKNVTDEQLQALLGHIDTVYAKVPEWRRINADGTVRRFTYIVAPGVEGRRGSTLAYTYLGHDTIWFSSKTARNTLDAPEKPSITSVPVSQWSMAANYENNRSLYTVAHEFGHVIDTNANNATRGKVVGSYRRRLKNPAWWSEYGRENPKEAYAEAFAQWVLGEKTPVTEAFANHYGWDLSLQDFIATNRKWTPGYKPPGGLVGGPNG